MINPEANTWPERTNLLLLLLLGLGWGVGRKEGREGREDRQG